MIYRQQDSRTIAPPVAKDQRDQWRDGTQQVPEERKAPKSPRDPETGAYREG